jgi:hypothetical protein
MWASTAIDVARKLTSEDVLEQLSNCAVRSGVPGPGVAVPLVRLLRLHLSKRLGAIPWQGGPRDRD